MYQHDQRYFQAVEYIPIPLMEKIRKQFIKIDYVNTDFTVTRKDHKAPWRLVWTESGRPRSIIIGMEIAVACTVEMLVDKRYLEELCVVLTRQTKRVQDAKEARKWLRKYDRESEAEVRRAVNQSLKRRFVQRPKTNDDNCFAPDFLREIGEKRNGLA